MRFLLSIILVLVITGLCAQQGFNTSFVLNRSKLSCSKLNQKKIELSAQLQHLLQEIQKEEIRKKVVNVSCER